MKRKDLLDCDGQNFAAKIQCTPVRGKVSICENRVYLCQNIIPDSIICKNMYGYKHAYYVNIGTEYDLQRSSVTDFAIIPQSPKFEEFYDWSIGDIIQSKSGAAHEIIFRSGEFMARKPLHEDGEEYVICSTCKELYDGGWRLFEPPKNMSIEVTTEDIRKALNIPDGSRIIITK